MTYRVLYLLFLVPLCSSINTGLKVRLTTAAQHVWNDFGLSILSELVGRELEKLISENGDEGLRVERLRLQSLPDEALESDLVLQFQPDSKIKFQVNRLSIIGQLVHPKHGHCSFRVHKLGITIVMTLLNKSGHMSVQVDECEFSYDDFKISEDGSVKMWFANTFSKINDGFSKLSEKTKNILTKQLCPLIKSSGRDTLNSKLKDMTMPIIMCSPFTGLPVTIEINNSPNGEFVVATGHLDVSLHGLVSERGNRATEEDLQGIPQRQCNENAFGDDKLMGYVCISELFVNSFTLSLYRGGLLQRTVTNEINTQLENSIWYSAGLRLYAITKLWHFKTPYTGELEIMNAPTITFTQNEKIRISVQCRARVFSGVGESRKEFITATAKCTSTNMEATITLYANLQRIPYSAFSITPGAVVCEINHDVPGLQWVISNDQLADYVKDQVRDYLQTYSEPIPLPEGMTFSGINMAYHYHNGFMVIAGNLNYYPDQMQNVAQGVVNNMLPQAQPQAQQEPQPQARPQSGQRRP